MDGARLDECESRVRDIVGAASVSRQVPLGPLTTFRTGGPADLLIDVRRADDVGPVVSVLRGADVPVTVLGGGSNVLVSDRGVRGAVLRVALLEVSQPTPETVRAGAGVTINGLVRWTVGRGLAGLEAWAGTPGTVGGAVYGNAHYAGVNISSRVTEVALVARAGTLIVVPHDQMQFGYDHSRLKTTGELLVWATFAVSAGVPESLRETARKSLAHRKRTQPLASASAGCIFQNPLPADGALPPGMPASAGALIDAAGLKGHAIGGARISPMHANFFLNERHATAAEIRALIDLAKTSVRDRFGVALREEIVYLGDW